MAGDERDSGPGRQPKGVLMLRTQALPKDANPNGDIFGGWIFAQMDMAAAIIAAEVSLGRTVTLAVDKMVFEHPMHVGEAVSVYADLLHVGNSSMDIKLEVWTKDLFGPHVGGAQLVSRALSATSPSMIRAGPAVFPTILAFS